MGAREQDLTTGRSFLGINNLSKESSLAWNVLREAVNVDMDRDGKLSSRKGYSAPVVACTNGHSLWTDKFLAFGLFADGADLRAFWPSETAETLRSDLAEGLPISYARINDAVFWTNGVQRGMVGLDLASLDWACEQPAGQPELAASPGTGSFKPGTVQVAVTFIDVLGRESGASLAGQVQLDDLGGVQVSNIPQPVGADVVSVRIYATSTDGAALALATQLPVGITDFTMLRAPEGRLLATQHLRPMPAGHIIATGNGRQFVARENVIFWSPALRYGLFHPGHSHLRFPARITMMVFVGDGTDGAGLFVACGDRTYWLGGKEPAQWRQVVASPYGAVEGTACVTPARKWGIESDTEVPAWLSKNGRFVVGMPGGVLVTMKDDEAVTGVGERGASLFREADGLTQFLTSLRAPTRQRAGVADTAVAKVYRYDAR